VELHLKAIVLKTPRLKETLAFFTGELGFMIKESSPTHFVIHSEAIRILFVESNKCLGVEFYLTPKSAGDIIVLKDPNQIKIVVC
jgi:hypothetical protein